MRDDQDVGEQDRGVEAEAADRLQRHLLGEPRSVAEVEERARLFAGLPVFRQIAARLAHDPDRQRPDRLRRSSTRKIALAGRCVHRAL